MQGQVFLHNTSFSGEELRRRSSTDFSDVFGGPPKRFSHHKTPSTISSSGDDSEAGGRLEREEAAESYQRWQPSSLIEKPVFGVVESPARRRHLGNDFFSDIFKGSESPGLTPRKNGANTGSSMLSPGRSFSHLASDAGGELSTENLSFSSRIAESFDNSPISSPPRTFEKAEESKGNASVHSINKQSGIIPKNDQLANNQGTKTEPTAMAKEMEVRVAEELTMKDSNGNFTLHFSMYKWANKGVTLVMPTNLKEKSKGRSRLAAVYAQVSQEPLDLPPDKENLPKDVQASQNPVQSESRTSKHTPGNVKAVSPEIVAEVLQDILHMSAEAGAFRKEGAEVKNLHHMMTDELKREAEVGAFRKEGVKEKNLSHMISADLEKEEKKGTTWRLKEKDAENGDIKISTRNKNSPPKTKQGLSQNLAAESYEKNSPSTRNSSRVKESVKIFESSELLHRGLRKPRVEDRQGPNRVNKDQDSINVLASDVPIIHVAAHNLKEEHLSTNKVNKNEDKVKHRTSAVPVVPTSLNLKEERAKYDSPSIRKFDRSFSEIGSIGNISRTFSGSTLSGLDATFCGIEVMTVDDVEDFLVVDISPDCNEVAEAKQREDEIQKSDAKIREWSRGREGNIRSLLSTLQNVLWPDSGWKPVKLVDIVEGSAVKRSYQRALLYLHPDKLQQKGAEAHQKYIAEKVFTILQEAWDQFNSMGSI